MAAFGSRIVLLPGDIYFGDKHATVRTLLGSCVAITLWHPQKRIGGMCHYVLPDRKPVDGARLNGRYANEAMQLFLHEIKIRNTRPEDYRVKMYGAANMFPDYADNCAVSGQTKLALCNGCYNVSCRNRHAAHHQTSQHGFRIMESDLGGVGHRMVELNIADGNVLVVKATQLAVGKERQVSAG